MQRDIYGEPIPTDMCADSPEGLAAWNMLARVSVEEGFAFFTDHEGNRAEAPLFDSVGRAYFQLVAVEFDEKPAPHARTLADINPDLNPDDAFDRAMGELPIYASLADKAKAALRANVPGVVVQARLRCSAATVCAARRELRVQLPEEEWPESLANAKGQARRVNAERPNMRKGAGGHPMEKRAAALGVSVADAQMLASDKARVSRYGERPKDLKAAANAGEYRARKKAEQGE